MKLKADDLSTYPAPSPNTPSAGKHRGRQRGGLGGPSPQSHAHSGPTPTKGLPTASPRVKRTNQAAPGRARSHRRPYPSRPEPAGPGSAHLARLVPVAVPVAAAASGRPLSARAASPLPHFPAGPGGGAGRPGGVGAEAEGREKGREPEGWGPAEGVGWSQRTKGESVAAGLGVGLGASSACRRAPAEGPFPGVVVRPPQKPLALGFPLGKGWGSKKGVSVTQSGAGSRVCVQAVSRACGWEARRVECW